jgi:hypothetical protein
MTRSFSSVEEIRMILADNGSAMFVSGVPDNRWNNTNLNLLKNIAASNFEVVQRGSLRSANVPTGPSPTIRQFHSESNECHGRFAGNPKLDGSEQHLQSNQSASGTCSRDADRRHSLCDHNLYPLLDQSVRSNHCHGYGDGALMYPPCLVPIQKHKAGIFLSLSVFRLGAVFDRGK